MFLVKIEEVGQAGKYPGSRSVEELLHSGIIILDKWPGPTSHDVAATVKKTLGLSKVGHGGTLDPAVSGVLPITLENACKVIPALQHLDKEYVGIMRTHKDIALADVKKAAAAFVGKIKQTPPKRSAVARKERERNVYSLEILEQDGRDFLFKINCEAGTYVRVVCHEIGKKIGGANMAELRRTKAGRFGEEMVKMEDLTDAYVAWKKNGSQEIKNYILPVEAAIEHLPKIIVKDSSIASIANGSPVYTPAISKISDDFAREKLVAVLTLKGELIALAYANMDAKEALSRKGIAAKTDRVILRK